MKLVTASLAAQARGLPPKVVPCMPGFITWATPSRAAKAPMGTPPAMPLAMLTMSGLTP